MLICTEVPATVCFMLVNVMLDAEALDIETGTTYHVPELSPPLEGFRQHFMQNCVISQHSPMAVGYFRRSPFDILKYLR